MSEGNCSGIENCPGATVLSRGQLYRAQLSVGNCPGGFIQEELSCHTARGQLSKRELSFHLSKICDKWQRE